MAEDSAIACANHPTEQAAASCASCSRPLCSACWLRTVDNAPWCEACVFDLESAPFRRWPLGVSFSAICVVITVTGWRYETRAGGEPTVELWATVLIAGVIGAGYLVVRGGRAHGRSIAKRPTEGANELVVEKATGHPYRARLRRVARQIAPPLSGRATTAILLACMLLCAVALPALFGLPRWIEAELVVGSWWIFWSLTLAGLLYRGFRLSDDHVYRWPSWPGSSAETGTAPSQTSAHTASSTVTSTKKSKFNWGDCAGCDPGCGEATPAILLGIVIAGLALVVAFLLVELVLPAVFFVAYLAVRGALARVANDDHGCEGSLMRSIGWGTLWATLYGLPLSAVVVGVHLVMAR